MFVILVAAWATLGAQDPTRLVEQLGSDDLDERDRAVVELKKAGNAARPVLERTARTGGEAALRAETVLAYLDWDPLLPDWAKRHGADTFASPGLRRRLVIEDEVLPPAALPRLILDPDDEVAYAAADEADRAWRESGAYSRAVVSAALQRLGAWHARGCPDGHQDLHLLPSSLREILKAGTDARDVNDLQALCAARCPEVRATAASVLVDRGERPEDVLLDLMATDTWSGEVALWALGRLKCRRAVPGIVALLGCSARRRDALHVLAQIGDPAAIPAVVEEVRRTSRMEWALAAALIALRAREALPHLEARVREGDFEDPLVTTLFALRGEEFVDVIIERVESGVRPPRIGQIDDGLDIRSPQRIRELLAIVGPPDHPDRPLEELLGYADPVALQAAARELLESPDDRVQTAALSYVDTSTPDGSAAAETWAARAIKNAKHRGFYQAVDILWEKGPRPEPAVVAWVAEHRRDFWLLPRFGSPADTDAFFALLKDASEDHERIAILGALWQHGGEKGRARVRQALASPDECSVGLNAVLQVDPQELARLLEPVLDDPSPPAYEVFIYGAAAKGAGVPRLSRLLDARFPEEVRYSSLRALEEMGPRDDSRQALRAICGAQDRIGDEAREILMRWNDEDVRPLLEARWRRQAEEAVPTLRHPDPSERQKALENMCRARHCPDVAAVVRAARLDVAEVRRVAIRVLRRIRSEEAIPALRRILDDSPGDVLTAAEAALTLETLGDRTWRAPVEALLDIRGREGAALVILDFVQNAQRYRADTVPILHIIAPSAEQTLQSMGARDGFAVEVTPQASRLMRGRSASTRIQTLQGVVAAMQISGVPIACRWDGQRVVVCTVGEALRRREIEAQRPR